MRVGKVGETRHFPPYTQATRGEGWDMRGRKLGEARHFPPYTQARWLKGGERVGKRWAKPGTSHPIPRQDG